MSPRGMVSTTADKVRILGIDPGSQVTGYGVIDSSGSRARYVTSGTLRLEREAFPRRLQRIYAAVADLVAELAPAEVAIERVFVHRNADSALKLGQARGAALCGVFAHSPLTVHEYSPREIKLSVVGRGGAPKQQVQHMVKVLLALEGAVQADAADALAVALCHAASRHTVGLIAAQLAGRGTAGGGA